jgi:hypothetical protein
MYMFSKINKKLYAQINFKKMLTQIKDKSRSW